MLFLFQKIFLDLYLNILISGDLHKMITLKKLTEDFYQISGMGITIVDKHFHTVLTECRSLGEAFCTTIHQSANCLKTCIQSDNIGFRKAEQERACYAYTCPFGIQEAIVPIFEDHALVAYMIVVMGRRNGERDSIPVDLAMKSAGRSNDFQTHELRELISLMPHNASCTIDSYLHMLTLMADYIGNHHLLHENQQSLGELIKEYIRQNLDQKITLMSLSKKFHRSTVTLTECFRKEFGTSIMQYVLEKRLESAARLLKDTDTSVGEIARNCGFQDAEYFSRCFKSKFGLAPSVWKRK